MSEASKAIERVRKSLARKDAAMLKAWRVLRGVLVSPGNPHVEAIIADAVVTLRQEMGPDAYAETIKIEGETG